MRSLKSHEYLNEIIELAKKYNHKLSVVIAPVNEGYKEYLPESDYLFEDVIQLLKNKNIPLYNFYSSSNYSDEDFYDFDHLNLKGAKKLTCELKEIMSKTF